MSPTRNRVPDINAADFDEVVARAVIDVSKANILLFNKEA
jgi:hypothetical protein